MTVDLFLVYLDHFQKYTKCSPEDPVLLLLDNHHVSHISLEAVERARSHGIVMLTTQATTILAKLSPSTRLQALLKKLAK